MPKGPAKQFAIAPTKKSPTYSVAHACFACRKSFKLGRRTSPTSTSTKCPDCGEPLVWMGRSFKAPKRSEINQWRKVEMLWQAGFRFFSYRSYPDAEPLPAKLSETKDFIRRNTSHPFRIG